MRDLKSASAIWLKGWLFLFLGIASAACRAYYFAFYVIQHYVDDGYKFSGLISFCRYLLARKR
jgi:hypothetical protein